MNHQRICLLLVLLLLLSVFSGLLPPANNVRAVGVTYYVSISGSDSNDGLTVGTPVRHIQKAINKSGTSDIIVIRGGDYNEKSGRVSPSSCLYLNRSGTLAAPYIIMGYPGETAIINGAGITTTSGYGVISIGGLTPYNNITIKDLTIKNATKNGITAFGGSGGTGGASKNITIQNVKIINSYYSALAFMADGYIPLISNININNCTFDQMNQPSDSLEGVSLEGSCHAVVRDCKFANCTKSMLCFWNTSRDITIYNNTFFNPMTYSSALAGAIYIDGGQAILPLTSYASHVNISKNYIHGNLSGLCIGPEKTGGSVDNISIFNNKINVYCNGASVFKHGFFFQEVYGAGVPYIFDNISFIYNTVCTNGTGTQDYAIYFNGVNKTKCKNIVLSNNIVQSNGGDLYQVATYNALSTYRVSSTDSFLHYLNNCFNNSHPRAPNTIFKDGTGKFGTSPVLSNPKFKSRVTSDFHLNYSSPCIDAGSSTYTTSKDYDNNNRPQGIGYDIGAYEWSPNIGISNPVPTNTSSITSKTPTVSITITTPKGWKFNYTMRTNDSSHPTSWMTRASANNQGNGSYTFIYTNVTTGNSKYWWKVTTVNHSVWHNETYWFTTGILTPTVSTNDSTGVEETNSTLQGYLNNDGIGNSTSGLYENYPTTGITYDKIYSTHCSAQSFTATANHYITNISLFLAKAGTPNTLYIGLKAVDGAGKPTGVDLSSGTYNANSLTGVLTWTNISMTPSYLISTGIKYALVIKAFKGTSTTNSVYVGYHPWYADGDAYLSTNNGSTWSLSAFPFYDYNFKIWGTSIYSCRVNFQYGTTTSYVTETLAEVKSTGSHFSKNITGLTEGQLYHFRAKAVNNNGTSYGIDKTFLTKPEETTALTITNTGVNNNQILNWIHGLGYNRTVIRAKIGSYPSTPQSDTSIYNNTGLTTTVNNLILTPGKPYYYKAWEYTAWGLLHQFSDAYSSAIKLSKPFAPTNAHYVQTMINKINITWTKGTGANRTIIVNKSTGYPTSVTDGTILYNGTASYYNMTITGATYFMRAYSYTTWTIPSVSTFSDNGTNITAGTSPGRLIVNCFNETSGLPIHFDVMVTNESGSKVYSASNISGYTIISTNSTPRGEHVTVFFASHYYKHYYSSRIYYIDIYAGVWYNLSGYLARINPQMITNNSYPYLIRVINMFNNPLDGVHVIVKGVINASGNFTKISDGYTDANGGFVAYLIPSRLYKVFLSKDTFISSIQNLLPDPIFYGDNYPTTYYLYESDTALNQLMNNIVLTVVPTYTSFESSFTIFYNISSSDSMLQWYTASFYFYNTTTDTWVLLFTSNFSSTIGGSISYVVPNSTGSYKICYGFKKTGFDLYMSNSQYYSIWYYLVGPTGLDDLLNHTIGYSPVYVHTSTGDVVVSWTALITAVGMLFVLFTFSPKFAGLGVMALGAVLGFCKGPLGFIPDSLLSYVAIGAIIILGFLMIIEQNKET